MSVCAVPVQPDYIKCQEELACHYVLQVALQTMKERCQQLQTRLSIVEDENLKLKIEKQRQLRLQESKITRPNSPNNVCVDKLHEQVASLCRQKSQLTQHIYMVATENKHLWTKLSILTENNESLDARLKKISEEMKNFPNKSDQLLQEVQSRMCGQSLDEISLKLMNTMRQEKADVTQHEQVIEIQSLKDCDFNLRNSNNENISDIDEDCVDLTNNLQICKSQLMNLLSTLRHQNEMLHKDTRLLKANSDGDPACTRCQKSLLKDGKMYCDVEIPTQPQEVVEKDSIDAEVQNINEMLNMQSTCPICNEFSSPSKDEIAEHVLLHFPPTEIADEEEFVSLLVE